MISRQNREPSSKHGLTARQQEGKRLRGKWGGVGERWYKL